MLIRLVTWAHGGGPRVRVEVCVSSSQWILSIVPKMKIKMGIADWLAYLDTTLRMQTLLLPIQDAHEVRGPSKVLESLHANSRRISLLDNHIVWSSYLYVKATLIWETLPKWKISFLGGGSSAFVRYFKISSEILLGRCFQIQRSNLQSFFSVG